MELRECGFEPEGELRLIRELRVDSKLLGLVHEERRPEIRSKLKGLDAIIKDLDAFEDKSQLLALVGETNETIDMNLRIAPAASLELLLARDEFIEKLEGAELGEGMKLEDLIRAEEAPPDRAPRRGPRGRSRCVPRDV